MHSRGKENSRGGARVVKPDARLKPIERGDEDDVFSLGFLSTISKPEPRSPIMMDPENHSENNSRDVGEFHKESEGVACHEDVLLNTSYGRIEGVGVAPGCGSREVELENKLEIDLAASEDLGQSLPTELEGSLRQMETLSTSINNGENFKEVKHVREVEEQCCSLAQKVEELTKELHEKEDKLCDMAEMMVSVKVGVVEIKEKAELVQIQLNEEIKKIDMLEEEVKQKDELIKREINDRKDVERRLESTQIEVQRLELEMSMKDEEIKNLTETAVSQSCLSSSMVQDVSLDGRVIEEIFKNQPCLAPLFTPDIVPIQSPIRRGPSASSTPSKGRLGSISDELKELDRLDTSPDFPSPFCKKGNRNNKKVLKFVDRLEESLRKIMVDQIEPGGSREVLINLNKEVLAFKRMMEIEEMDDDTSSMDELRTMKENTAVLEEKLAEANAVILSLKNDKDLKKMEPDLQDKEVEQGEGVPSLLILSLLALEQQGAH
eukprot:GFUD01044464.1.p1 GENE.GFUD01044464.1~~GFUD01044464.1.p1  ORF type:complete len:512 (+),score=182.19 GFUD01044464.1:63-1538(+)